MKNMLIACADIGAVRRDRFGWADNEGKIGREPSALACKVAAALSAHRHVALGFECPLTVPLAEYAVNLTSSRRGEGNRPWSAGAGCASLATGLVQVTWTLCKIRQQLVGDIPVFLDWDKFRHSGYGLFLWEAFVTGGGKGSDHVDDARLAVERFSSIVHVHAPESEIVAENPISLAGLALLRSDMSCDVSLLSSPCLVIRS